ncbi:MAG: hypothetical protein RJB34_1621 [Pseudomonadota bacterium]|jgi:CheY-like chemotaxis protein
MRELRKIMCAEDDPDIRHILGWSLQHLGGFELCLCESGESVLAQITDFAPDMLLLDVMMSGLSGPQTLALLREHGQLGQDVPVLFVTAKAMPDELQALMQHQVDGIIVKPFDPMQLPEKIRAHWSPKR